MYAYSKISNFIQKNKKFEYVLHCNINTQVHTHILSHTLTPKSCTAR